MERTLDADDELGARGEHEEDLERLKKFAATLYAEIKAARRVASRLGGSKKPDSLAVQTAILHELMSFNRSFVTFLDTVRASVSYPSIPLRSLCAKLLTLV